MNSHSPSRLFVGVSAALVAGILILSTSVGALGASPARPPARPTASAAADSQGGPIFRSGVFVDVAGKVNGDVYAAGQSVTISGDITGDVIAAAQTITITGTVDGNVRLAGQDITIDGPVTRSGTVAATNVIITESGKFGDDLVAAASDITIAGNIGRDVFVSVGRLSIDGSVGGDLTYVSDNEAHIAHGAVNGAVKRVEPPRSTTIQASPWAVFGAWFLGLLYALVALSLITLLAGLLFPRWLQRVTDHLVPSPWKALLVGFVASIAVPVALLFLLVTVIGAPLAFAGILVWTVLTLATLVYGAFYVGRLVFRGQQHPVVKSLVGGLILIAALQIPWLNLLVWIAMVCFGLGAQLLELYQHRPWAAEIEPGAVRAPLPPAVGGPPPPPPRTF